MVLSGLISLLLVVSANAAQIPLRSEHGKPLKHFGVSDDPKHAAEKTYDYVVVGGGLTGLAVAMRLAEHPSTTVLVLEAGQDDRFDQRVRNVNQYREIFKKDNGITWTWQTDHGRNITGYFVFLSILFSPSVSSHHPLTVLYITPNPSTYIFPHLHYVFASSVPFTPIVAYIMRHL